MDDVKHIKQFLDNKAANQMLESLLNLDWEQPIIKIFGKSTPIPRKQLLFTSPEVTNSYSYSGMKIKATVFDGAMKEIKLIVEDKLNISFNTALVNLYQNGNDYVGWHSDDESLLGINPVIVSLSLGGARFFHFRKKNNHIVKNKFLLENGDLFIMGPTVQKEWQHSILKEKKVIKPRVNITFRNVINPK